MPYESDAQRRWAHTKAGTKALGGPSKVKEWDEASKGKDLPMYAKGTGPKPASYAQGGPVLQTSRSIFMKTPNHFTEKTDTERQDYGGGKDKLAKREGDSKSLKPIKPKGT
jgi:hypothetical protein